MSAEDKALRKEAGLALLSLFGSASTLVCCALPALFVALGAGAALAGLVSHVPGLIWLSEHKLAVFSVAAALLLLAGWGQWRARSLTCPADPAQARACRRLRRFGIVVYLLALACYLIGLLFAYLLPALD